MDERYYLLGLVEKCILKKASRKMRHNACHAGFQANRLADTLRAEQYKYFRGETWREVLLSALEMEQPVSF
jgi:hypothetical protein